MQNRHCAKMLKVEPIYRSYRMLGQWSILQALWLKGLNPSSHIYANILLRHFLKPQQSGVGWTVTERYT